MRKSALTLKSNKVYNPNSLEVTGEKITLLSPEKTKQSSPSTRKTLKIAVQVKKNPPKAHEEKNVFKQSVREYKNPDVSNKVLKQIRETTKVEDFERILHTFSTSKRYIRRNSSDKLLERLGAENLYEEFFGRHFDYLWSLVEMSKE